MVSETNISGSSWQAWCSRMASGAPHGPLVASPNTPPASPAQLADEQLQRAKYSSFMAYFRNRPAQYGLDREAEQEAFWAGWSAAVAWQRHLEQLGSGDSGGSGGSSSDGCGGNGGGGEEGEERKKRRKVEDRQG